jgi:hypothetical protein
MHKSSFSFLPKLQSRFMAKNEIVTPQKHILYCASPRTSLQFQRLCLCPGIKTFPGVRYGGVRGCSFNKPYKITMSSTCSCVEMHDCNVCLPECDHAYVFKLNELIMF